MPAILQTALGPHLPMRGPGGCFSLLAARSEIPDHSHMGWIREVIDGLAEGRSVSFRPVGNSMEPRILPGQLCTVDPLDDTRLQVNDIVFCRVGRGHVLHLVVDIQNDQYLIGSVRGKINGWVERDSILGRLVNVQD